MVTVDSVFVWGEADRIDENHADEVKNSEMLNADVLNTLFSTST